MKIKNPNAQENPSLVSMLSHIASQQQRSAKKPKTNQEFAILIGGSSPYSRSPIGSAEKVNMKIK